MKPKEVLEFSDSALMIIWEDEHESIYLYEELRQLCPCATCNELRQSGERGKKGKTPFKRIIPLETPLKNLQIKPDRIDPVGLYAIRFKWNDGHETGIYPFEFLRRRCTCEKCKPN
ncbi:MAG: DUF971 domain-containing protein [Candidatus Dadabacteria bacterium]|nr:DUF971 domain-containing protein [Candidatus Dadabacteria bacterium]